MEFLDIARGKKRQWIVAWQNLVMLLATLLMMMFQLLLLE